MLLLLLLLLRYAVTTPFSIPVPTYICSLFHSFVHACTDGIGLDGKGKEGGKQKVPTYIRKT